MVDASLAQRYAADPAAFDALLQSLSDEEAALLLYDWTFWSRAKQRAPHGDWDNWLVLAGRGFGKTRTAAEFVRDEVKAARARRVAFLGSTAGDTRDILVEGVSGILAVSPKHERPIYEPSKRRLTWPNGAIGTLFSADEPERLRGPEHDLAWSDELCAWRYQRDAWDNLQFGLRLGQHPRNIVTTTPRPGAVLKELLGDSRTVVTRGTTYENTHNLAPAFRRKILAKYEGTRLGRQELNAEVLEDTPGALWTLALVEAARVRLMPSLRRIVVALDPSVAADGGGDECGIVVAGVAPCDCKKDRPGELHGFVIDDASGSMSPAEWAKAAVVAYVAQGADAVVAEVNNGGGLVEVNLRTLPEAAALPYKAVHASRGKRARAEPVASLYEQGKVHHVGSFALLESELTTWDASSAAPSPNRLDALVWALTELMLGEAPDAGYAGFV
jgi:phage terminase large subunit-like protein